jgi:choline dehydrogenase-like flavoprotein
MWQVGGTAGCVLASRLSEDPNVSILVLERGVANNTWMSRIPLVSADILRPDYGSVNWFCEPMKNCDSRETWVVRGEVLGGNSRINSMVYTRGGAAEYDAWSAMGHSEWSYDKVLPYFVKAETSLSTPESKYRGRAGTLVML